MSEHTPGPWRVAKTFEGATAVAPKGLDAAQRKTWDAIMVDRNKPMRENDGAFIVMSGTANSDNYRRIGTADLQVRAKRGQGHTTEDPEALANARLIAAAPDLLEALEDMLGTCAPASPKGVAASNKARAAIAKAKP